MVAVGKPASIQHFICLYNSRNVSSPPPRLLLFSYLMRNTGSLGLQPSDRLACTFFLFLLFFFFFFFILLQTVKPPCLRTSSSPSCQRVGVTTERGETSLQIPTVGPAL